MSNKDDNYDRERRIRAELDALYHSTGDDRFKSALDELGPPGLLLLTLRQPAHRPTSQDGVHLFLAMWWLINVNGLSRWAATERVHMHAEGNSENAIRKRLDRKYKHDEDRINELGSFLWDIYNNKNDIKLMLAQLKRALYTMQSDVRDLRRTWVDSMARLREAAQNSKEVNSGNDTTLSSSSDSDPADNSQK